jgi:hypothetical protein
MLDLFISHVQDSVCIPQKVRSEVTAEEREETRFIIRCIEDGKITVAKIKNTALAQKFSEDFNIDAGEAEALALAIEKSPDRCDGRQKCDPGLQDPETGFHYCRCRPDPGCRKGLDRKRRGTGEAAKAAVRRQIQQSNH